MRDTCQPFRKAIYDCLNGNITWNSANVPVYDEKTKVANTDPIFIILSTQQETPIDDNDCTWITLSSIDIEVIAKTGFEVTKNIIDAVADQVTTLILPTRQTVGIAAISGFQVANLIRASTLSQILSISDTESITRKVIKFQAEFVEQT